MSHTPRTTPIPRGYTWLATITKENEAYLVEIHGPNRRIVEYHAFGSQRNAQGYVTRKYGRVLWEFGNNVIYGYTKVKEPANA